MGQYWYVVNLDKKEFVHPHKLGTGLKLWEQLANHPGTGAALIVLCAAMPEQRGGGDFDLNANWHGPERKDFTKEGPTPDPVGDEPYAAIAKRTIGRWAGDRIALIGDYAEAGDLPKSKVPADVIYSLCTSDRQGTLEWLKQEHPDRLEAVKKLGFFTDISLDVAAVIEHELGGKFSGDGWRQWQEGAAEATT